MFPEYPFDSRRLDVGGATMHYLDVGPGDGPLVVMLHGNPTWSFYYRRLVAALADRYRCLVPDHVGMGLSEKPSDDRYEYTLKRRVDDIDRLLAAVAPDRPFSLIVHDWGGMIGATLAVDRPERIERLVVFNTAAFRLPPGKSLPWQLKLCRVPLLGSILVRGMNLFCHGAIRNCATRKKLPADVRRAYLAPYGSWRDRIAVHRFVEDIPLVVEDRAFGVVQQTERNLERLSNKPTLICWGMRDFVFDGDFLRRFEELLPAARVHRFDDAGHYVLEDAAEEIIPLVRAFLDESADP